MRDSISAHISAAPAPHLTSRIAPRAVYLRDLGIELILRDLKLRYKRSVLGIAWSLVTPLTQLLVLRFVFTVVLPLDVPHFTSFLFIGLLSWSWLASSLDQAAGSIIENRELVRQAGFPSAVIPVVSVAANLVHFLLALPILGLFIWLDGGVSIGWSILLLPVMIALQFVLILALAYFVAALHARFRDVKHLLLVVLTLGFYLTPVFYQVNEAPEQYRAFYNLNPMVHVLAGYREILLHAGVPAWRPLAVVAVGALALLFVGYRRFVAASARFVDEI